MRGKRHSWPWLARPQLWVGLATIFFTVLGSWLSLEVQAVGSFSFHPAVLAQVTSSYQPPPTPAPMPPDCALQPCLALTFDDGPQPVYTPQVLDILERHHARATFFVIGLHVPGNETLLQRMYRDGSEIGNHSWSHPDFTTLSLPQIAEQINQTQAVVIGSGVPAPTLFRPPYGQINPAIRSYVPLTTVMWNIDPEDWRARDAGEIVNHVSATAHPGGIIELHDTHQHTAEALDLLLTNLEQHYQLVTVSELLSLPPGQRGIYYGR